MITYISQNPSITIDNISLNVNCKVSTKCPKCNEYSEIVLRLEVQNVNKYINIDNLCPNCFEHFTSELKVQINPKLYTRAEEEKEENKAWEDSCRNPYFK